MKTICIFFASLLVPAALICQFSGPSNPTDDAWLEAIHQVQTTTDLPPPKVALNLEQWLNLAMENNLSIHAGGMDVDIASEKRNEVNRAFIPTVNLASEAQYYTKMPKQMLPASTFGGPENTYNAAEMGVPLNITSYAKAQQLLFNKQVGIQKELATLNIKTAGLQQNLTTEDVIWQVSATYYQAQVLRQQQALLEQNVANLDRLLEKTNLLAQHTLARQSDVDKLLVQKNLLENEIANTADSYDAQIRLLRYLTNAPAAESMTVALVTEDVVGFPSWTANMGIHRTETELLFQQQLGMELERESIHAQRLPVASAFTQTGLTNYGKFGDGAFTEAHSFSSIGLQVSCSLFDGGIRRSKMQQKTIELHQIRLQQQQLGENILREVGNAQSSLRTQYDAIFSQQKNMALAEKLFNQSDLQFREGLVDIQEVIDRQNALTEAQTSYVSALIQFRLAELDLKKASGNLLNNN
ncbi:MAG: TolC family protein [Lewinellaceae bacterium]|nr:TolC family protein [Saprospiraceae bacterium]MCB9337948.1 TolC family protein [Lewinellaceae bacterium]